MDIPNNIPTAALYDIQSIQKGIYETVDAAAEAARRRQEIGYAIDQYPAQGTHQPR